MYRIKLLVAILLVATVAYAGTTLREQDFPEEFVFGKFRTEAQLQSEACTGHPVKPCLRFNTDDFDLYTSTGNGGGDWRNLRQGTGPGGP